MANQGKNGIDVILAESLKELSKTRPIEKITIKESICLVVDAVIHSSGIICLPFHTPWFR